MGSQELVFPLKRLQAHHFVNSAFLALEVGDDKGHRVSFIGESTASRQDCVQAPGEILDIVIGNDERAPNGWASLREVN